jgi:hypothetical protein
MRILLIGAAVLAALISVAQGSEPKEAEFAIRWSPSDGGPQTPVEVFKILHLPKSEAENYEVRYFDEPPALIPPESTSIVLRLRSMHDGNSEVRLKYRRATPWPADWKCPAALRFKRSEQLDVTFLNAGAIARTYSYECTLDAGEKPPALEAAIKNCSSFMVRYDGKRARLEEWVLPGGKVILEVSHTAENTDAELARFRPMVDTLLAHHARASEFSKSNLGSECPK